jgi:hypothetical protein
MQSVEEIAHQYETKPRPECPRCLSSERVAFIVRGRPTASLGEYASRPNSRVWLGGCIVGENDPHFYCRTCEAPFDA